MKQVGANQIDDLVKKEKMQNERLITQAERTRIVANITIDLTRIEERQLKHISFRDLMSKKNDEKQSSLDGDNVRITQKKFGALMGVSSGLRKNLEEKENRAKLAKATFLKATKRTVLINSLKQGQVICTCSSLDVQCAKHDS
jgi:hypothetical protein